jgi:hypothetical protein
VRPWVQGREVGGAIARCLTEGKEQPVSTSTPGEDQGPPAVSPRRALANGNGRTGENGEPAALRPTNRPWREQALTRGAELRTLLDWYRAGEDPSHR